MFAKGDTLSVQSQSSIDFVMSISARCYSIFTNVSHIIEAAE